MVATAVENTDDCHGLIQDGVGGHDALPVADRPQPGTEVLPRQTTVGEIS